VPRNCRIRITYAFSAAVPLLAGLFFLHRWFNERQDFDAVIGFFYWPLLLGIITLLVVHYRNVIAECRTWLSARRISLFVALLLSVVIFSFSFIAYNYASAGRATAWELNDLVLNKPFSFKAALQTVVLYGSEVVLTRSPTFIS
jgi:hypothetical protein